MKSVISEKEQLIVAALAASADRPLTEVSADLKLPVHVIRYALERLKQEKLVRSCPFINLFALGYTNYSIYVRLLPEWRLRTEELVGWLRSNESVVWVAQFGGDFELCIQIAARSASEVVGFLEALTAGVGECIADKSIVCQAGFYFFPAHYWQPRNSIAPVIRCESVVKTLEIDDVDKRILIGLVQGNYNSRRELARQLGFASSTFESRLSRLIENRVISDTVYLVNSPALGMQPFKVRVHLKGCSSASRKALWEICATSSEVTTFIPTVGVWDFEIGIEVSDSVTAPAFIDKLHKRLGASLAHVELMQHFRDLKLVTFPFGKNFQAIAVGE